VDSIADYFARVYQERMTRPDPRDIDWIRRFQSRWGIYRDPYELWEVEFAWFDDTFMTARKTNFAYWRTTPVGTIAYIDEYDLPIADHYARAKAIVAAGSAFAIVATSTSASCASSAATASTAIPTMCEFPSGRGLIYRSKQDGKRKRPRTRSPLLQRP
jgi:hypothetical protein